ncbi:MAG: glycosyltransferase [Clostridia bacterium]|nr:glycosyltransferase [Clostridia bacterium]
MIRVGLFLDTFYPMVDGVIEVVHNYASRLNADGEFEVTVFCPNHGKNFVDNFPYKVVRCKSVRTFFLDYSLPLPKFDRQFKKILKESQLDIVHIHSPFMIGEVALAYAKKHNIPVISTMHSQFEQDFYRATHNKFITKKLLKRIMKVFNGCDECYAVSPAVSDIFVRYGANHKPPYMYSGTDMLPVENVDEVVAEVNAEYGIPSDMPVFLFVGRITVLKNIFFLAEALSMLEDKYFKLIVAGDGKDMPAFKKRVSEAGLDDNVIYLGRVADRELLRRLYCRATLFLFPSAYDTNSLVQKEAASQSTPTVFMEGTATASNVTDGVNGFIAPATPEAYARKIQTVLADEQLLKTVSEGAKRDLYRTWDEAVDEMKQVYRQIAQPKE